MREDCIMTHYDQTMKAYADNGYRSAVEWLSLGREVAAGATPRTEAIHNRAPVALYTRDQTTKRSRRTDGVKR
jgi:hypothetical protein